MKAFIYIVVLFVFLLLCSCSLIAPDPSSEQIKNLTVDICRSLMRDQLIQVIAPQQLGMSPMALANCGYPELKYDAWYEYYEQPVHGKVPNNFFNKVVDEVELQMDSFEFELENIRIIERSFSTRKTDFVATLSLKDGAYVNVTASAQYTTDDNIWVSVQPLEPPNL